ncbi:MAG: ABC transporter ATP-binding protein, partial [Acidobacteriaceae bacterium]|nr:ABC transporter ATP-binding protein [Acidobacteriaceae bacterium]
MTDPLLKVRDLTVHFRGSRTAALSGVSFDLSRGETVAVLGESGAGKTTLARTILRLLPEASASVSGEISFLGVNLLGVSERTLRRIRGAQIALISQNPELALSPVLRVRDQVAEVVRAHVEGGPTLRRSKAEEALTMAGLSQELALAYPHQLSGGQLQRVVIAQALILRPALLIMDEPTSALDNLAQAEILQLVKDLLHRLKLTLIFITHDPVLVRSLADEVLVFRHGSVVEAGTFERTLRCPQHSYTTELIRAIPPLPPRPAKVEPTPSGASGLLEDETVDDRLPSRHDASVEVAVIEAYEVTKVYPGGRRALDGATLRLPACSSLALVGRSGSGKSTLARCLALLENPDSGEIRFRGESIFNGSGFGGSGRDRSTEEPTQNGPGIKRAPQRAAGSLPCLGARIRALCAAKEFRRVRSKIQLVWQHSAMALNPRLSAVDLVAEPLRISKLASGTQSREQALQMMAKLGLSRSLALRSTLELSGGQRQRLALARALVISPSVLILDEAFAGLDLVIEREIVTILLELQ